MGALSSTRVAKHFGIANTRVNLVLAELGWIEKFVKGWVPTERGSKRGGQQREMRNSGVPYVVWPESILSDRVFLASLRESIGDVPAAEPKGSAEVQPGKSVEGGAHADSQDFRTRFPASFRATDGHMVRSRGEMLIDNWLYMQGLAHAIERRLPVEEDVYCDFYLPGGKVYIEYWGLENDAKYAKRMEEKKGIYAKYKLNLVELTDELSVPFRKPSDSAGLKTVIGSVFLEASSSVQASASSSFFPPPVIHWRSEGVGQLEKRFLSQVQVPGTSVFKPAGLHGFHAGGDNEQIRNLDDALPRLLIRYNIDCT